MLAWWKQYALIRDNYFKWFELPDDELETHGTKSYNYLRSAELNGEGGAVHLGAPRHSVRGVSPNPLAA